jgi:hypothetical protein
MEGAPNMHGEYKHSKQSIKTTIIQTVLFFEQPQGNGERRTFENHRHEFCWAYFDQPIKNGTLILEVAIAS